MFPSGPLGRIVGDTHRRHPPLVKCSRLVRKAGLLATLIVVILLSSGPSSRAVVRKCSRLVRKAGLLATLTAVVRKCSRLVRKAGLLATLIIIVIVTIVSSPSLS